MKIKIQGSDKIRSNWMLKNHRRCRIFIVINHCWSVHLLVDSCHFFIFENDNELSTFFPYFSLAQFFKACKLSI